jgi:dTDP-4-amino-4,6-dideoxygalactose transaminase
VVPLLVAIGYGIYYPVPLHQQKFIHQIVGNGNYPMADVCSREVLSIPVHPLLKKEELEHVVDLIKYFCQEGFN